MKDEAGVFFWKPSKVKTKNKDSPKCREAAKENANLNPNLKPKPGPQPKPKPDPNHCQSAKFGTRQKADVASGSSPERGPSTHRATDPWYVANAGKKHSNARPLPL